MKTIAIIGSGISGLSAAAYLASKGQNVLVFEKNNEIGGRMRQHKAEGFTFDMGPSWYWMPDVFDTFFENLGHKTSDFYELKKLDPGFQIITSNNEIMKIPACWDNLLEMIENIEAGAAERLKEFMKEAAYKYEVGIKKLVYKPGLSVWELLTKDTIKGVFRLQLFSSYSAHVRKYFSNKKIIALMEFPVLFLGAMPKDTPALYSLMNYAGLYQGTFYPMGGLKKVTDAMQQAGAQRGVKFYVNEAVESVTQGLGYGIDIKTSKRLLQVDGIIASADYHHVEQKLLNQEDRNYAEQYWQKKTFAPSSLLFYIGVNRKLPRLEHHNLFFDADFDDHARAIYEKPEWPDQPLFYVCCPSKTDPDVAPSGMENLFILMPIAPDIEDSEEKRESYFVKLLTRLEKFTGVPVREHIVYKRSYCVEDFKSDYNSYKGNAYGLANTLMQTANLKPKIKNKHIQNFYYTGQLTVPGPGVPPSIISGQVAATELLKSLRINI
ncbi:phytoene desaturase family protein [Sporocytophaga myxococcoides]|uniref:phytoene desaturase family protein n=1 Tax=Sporocytophaga myxococcoides TaxID=153721 RepID=UPI00040904C9|nr:phytoene desaturase family protein [Sporocytophaga myxococcoides]